MLPFLSKSYLKKIRRFMNTKKFTHSDLSGSPLAVVSIQQMPDGMSLLKYNKPEIHQPIEVWNELFEQAVTEATRSHSSKKLGCRLHSDYDLEKFQQILGRLNFELKSKRVEFKQDLVNLPTEQGTPFRWKSLKELNWDRVKLIDFITEITQGALDVEPDDKVEDFIEDFLSNEELTSGPECVHIGFLNENLISPCAFIVAQIEPKSGWSRLSYMGLIPEFRGKKLGQWVHKHGFEMMKAQGGKLYHGGTLINNLSMRKLFIDHGCKEFCALEEWHLKLSEVTI